MINGDSLVTQSTENEKLVVAVVPNNSANAVEASLLEGGFRVTRVNSAGGFLKRGNVTVLVGARADQVDEIIEKMHNTGRDFSSVDVGLASHVVMVDQPEKFIASVKDFLFL